MKCDLDCPHDEFIVIPKKMILNLAEFFIYNNHMINLNNAVHSEILNKIVVQFASKSCTSL